MPIYEIAISHHGKEYRDSVEGIRVTVAGFNCTFFVHRSYGRIPGWTVSEAQTGKALYTDINRAACIAYAKIALAEMGVESFLERRSNHPNIESLPAVEGETALTPK